MNTQSDTDCVVVGASFAGLASALALARAGLRVTVLEKKADPGTKLHTTGIIVKDAIDQIALLDTLPTAFVRRIPGVRLYAPNLRHVDLEAPGYYFLATATPAVMRWLASETERAGATIAYNTRSLARSDCRAASKWTVPHNSIPDRSRWPALACRRCSRPRCKHEIPGRHRV